MRYLLDTCVLLWLANGETQFLSPTVLDILNTSDNELAISVVSFWELAMKATTGKLVFPGGSVKALSQRCEAESIDILPITSIQVEQFLHIPRLHPDPFDRLIASISLSTGENQYSVLSVDGAFDLYKQFGVRRVW